MPANGRNSLFRSHSNDDGVIVGFGNHVGAYSGFQQYLDVFVLTYLMDEVFAESLNFLLEPEMFGDRWPSARPGTGVFQTV